MSVPDFAFPESATLHTRSIASQDSDGNDVWSPSDVTVTGAFAPAGSTELVQGQDTVITNPTFYLSPGSPVPSATDQLTVRGAKYEIDGEPEVYANPFTGNRPGAVLRLNKVTG